MRTCLVVSTEPARFGPIPFARDLEEGLASLVACGYDGVELSIRDPSATDAEALTRLVRAHGLGVPAISTGLAWAEDRLSFTDTDPVVRRAAIDRAVAHVPFAARTDAVIIIGLLRGTAFDLERERAMEWLVDALAECADAAADAGVRLALEPLNRYETSLIHTVAEGLELLDALGRGNVGLLVDTFHMNIEEPGIESSIAASAGRIAHVHVADSNRRHPGAGHIDFRGVRRALAGAGYKGWVSGEFLPLPDPETSARNCLAYLRSIEAG